MSAKIITRSFQISDYEAAVELWTSAEGVEVSEGDSKDEVAHYLRRNPDLSRVADDSGRLVGVAMCGDDGRRGYIYHLAVHPDYQQKGVARRLVAECLEGLRSRGLKRALILVSADNPSGQAFWERCGWESVPEVNVMGMDLP
jgi:ribosomal protein S18 acetylase RimI-like enzyme